MPATSAAAARRVRKLAIHVAPRCGATPAAAAAAELEPAAAAAPRPLPDATVMREAFEIVSWAEPQRAAEKFRDFGFCLLGEALPGPELQILRQAAGDVFDEVAAYDTQRKGSRGAGRYGLGSMTTHPQWAAHLIDNPRVLPAVDEIWGHSRCELLRCGMNGSFPGSADQELHIDIGAQTFADSFSDLPIQGLPLFSLTVHYPVVDMCSTNGTIRIVPTSNTWPEAIPSLGEEPRWMRERCEINCPAGTAILKDIRVWHGGCSNSASPTHDPTLGVGANHARPMPNAQYNAPWFNRPGDNMRHLDYSTYETLSVRGQQLASKVTLPPGVDAPGYLLHGQGQIAREDDGWANFLKASGQRS